MAAYLFLQIRVTEPEAWSAYRDQAGPLALRFGGHYIVRGAQVEALEGSYGGQSLVVFEFPSMQAIHDFWASAEYLELKKLREGAAELDAWAVPGVSERR